MISSKTAVIEGDITKSRLCCPVALALGRLLEWRSNSPHAASVNAVCRRKLVASS